MEVRFLPRASQKNSLHCPLVAMQAVFLSIDGSKTFGKKWLREMTKIAFILYEEVSKLKKLLIPIIIAVALIAIVAAILVPSYNGFVELEEKVDQSYAQIDNQLQRRMDLIPNLVETVKGFASQEQAVIDSVTEARSNLAGAEGIDEQAEADSQLSGALSRLLVVVENYPELKSNENFQQLSDELAGTENRIAVARQDYNGVVSAFNSKAKSFPGNLTAGMFGFEEKPYFEADDNASDVPAVDFGNDKE